MSRAIVRRSSDFHRDRKLLLPLEVSSLFRGSRPGAIVLLAEALLLTACTTLTVGEGGGQAMVGIGLVRIELPRTQGSVLAVGRSGFGLGWDGLPGGGVWLGYSGGHWVIADPRECHLLVIIRSPAEAENAAKVLSALGGSSPCIVDHTGTLRP